MKVNFKKFMVLERLRDIRVGRMLNPLNLPKNLKAAYNLGDRFTKGVGKAKDILQGKATVDPGQTEEGGKKSIVARNKVFSQWRDRNINNMGTYQNKALKELTNNIHRFPDVNIKDGKIVDDRFGEKRFSNIGHYANQVMDKYVEYRNQRGYSEKNAGSWVATSNKFSRQLLRLLKRYGMLYPAIAKFIR